MVRNNTKSTLKTERTEQTESSPHSKAPHTLPTFRNNTDLAKISSRQKVSVKMFEDHNKHRRQFSFIPQINRKSAEIASKIVSKETSINKLNHFKLNLGQIPV